MRNIAVNGVHCGGVRGVPGGWGTPSSERAGLKRARLRAVRGGMLPMEGVAIG